MRDRSYEEWSVNGEEQREGRLSPLQAQWYKGSERKPSWLKRLSSAEIRISIRISSLAAV